MRLFWSSVASVLAWMWVMARWWSPTKNITNTSPAKATSCIKSDLRDWYKNYNIRTVTIKLYQLLVQQNHTGYQKNGRLLLAASQRDMTGHVPTCPYIPTHVIIIYYSLTCCHKHWVYLQANDSCMGRRLPNCLYNVNIAAANPPMMLVFITLLTTWKDKTRAQLEWYIMTIAQYLSRWEWRWQRPST